MNAGRSPEMFGDPARPKSSSTTLSVLIISGNGAYGVRFGTRNQSQREREREEKGFQEGGHYKITTSVNSNAISAIPCVRVSAESICEWFPYRRDRLSRRNGTSV